MKNNHFSIKNRFKSVQYAVKGLHHVLITQHNAWIHAVASIAIIALAMALEISSQDWRWLVAAMTLVWFAETINTAFEYVCDVVSPAHHPSVEKAKDIAAAAVLICALGATTLGASTLGPYMIQHFL